MPAAPSNAQQITRSAKSNLAFALASLPPERRRDMETFYAFCRIVDDIADDPERPAAEKRARLADWRAALRAPVPGEDPLAAAVRALQGRYPIPPERFAGIIEGVERDLDGRPFATVEELRGYCHLVASVVGLVSIEIFGYRDPGCRDYARWLGLALQWTNILRDVGEDAGNGRLYLPLDQLARHGIAPDDLLAGRPGPGFPALMNEEAERAEDFYRRARAALPACDRRAMVAAEAMRRIYHAILGKMRRDGFRVLERRHRLGKLHMLALLVLTRLGW
jgi:15-cis-phytoene synthase